MKKIKHFAAALAACLIAGSMLSPLSVSAKDKEQEAKKTYPFGDVNLDEDVDVSDAVLLARFCGEDETAKITDEGKKLADVDQDGNLTPQDTIHILEFIAKIIPELGVAQQSPPEYKTVNLMQDIQAAQIETKELDAAFRSSQYALTANLLKQTNLENTERKNLLISPLSVSVALAMTANGAKEQTLTEMEQVLGGDLKIADLNSYYANVLNTLPNTKQACLYPANSIWIKDEPHISVPQEFLQTNANYYGADAFKTQFNNQAVKDINGWVNENTHEMIPQLIEKLPEDAFMCLINALAFEADWDDPYTEDQLGKAEFKPYNGDPFETDMLNQKLGIYLEDEWATGFIKYYKDCKYSFAAILPKESKSVTIGDYIGMMTAESLQNLLDSRKSCTVITSMPKFSFSYGTSLAKALKNMGMPTAFDEELSNFTGLNEGDGYIGDVIHKTFIQVDEAGTRAGAATAVIMMEKSAVEPEPKTVRLDRPFIFMILDEAHNLPVFIGYVMNPQAES